MVNFQVATSTSTDFFIRLSATLWDKSFALGRAGQGPPVTGGQTLRTGIQNPLRIHQYLRQASANNTYPQAGVKMNAVQAKFL
jgi:hypothetical protein